MKHSIKIEVITKFGQEMMLPLDEAANIFCSLAGTKTITRPMLKLITGLGYEVDINKTTPTLESLLA